jgi:hypothetical protein
MIPFAQTAQGLRFAECARSKRILAQLNTLVRNFKGSLRISKLLKNNYSIIIGRFWTITTAKSAKTIILKSKLVYNQFS